MVSSPSAIDSRASAPGNTVGPIELWQHLLGATTDEAFCSAWLALLCSQLTDVTAGVVLLRSSGSNTFTPVALWPHAPRDLSHLSSAAEAALKECRGVVQRAGEQRDAPWHIAYPLGDEQHVLGTVALEVPACPESRVQDLLRQLHWGLGLLRERLAQRSASIEAEQLQRIGSVMEVVATSLRQTSLQETLFAVTNLIARELAASRAVLGLVERSTVRVAAMSDAAWFEKNTDVVKRYTAAMEESLDQLATVRFESQPAAAAADPVIASEHSELARATGAHAIVSVPLQLGANCIGVLTVQRDGASGFTDPDIDWLDALAGLLPAAIDQKRRAERGFLARLHDDVRTLLARLFGPRHLVWKFCATTAALLICALVLVEMDYRVKAKTVIEGEVQRAAVAPFEGYVAASYVRAGDIVRKGQLLCTLEDRDLKLERDRWTSEREQHLRELREAMAGHDPTQVQIVGAQVRQAAAELALVTEKLARARVVAPFDGIVISGDLSQLIGSPVELGKKLFEVAPLNNYRVVLQVDESDIRNVHVGQSGRLLVSGITGEALPFKVSKVTPVATASDGRNFFRVEAQLTEAPPNLRPGMQGVGKVSVGERRLWWILTHSLTDWLRLSLWKWLP
jgi:hypothetical protein